jgi:aminoglycoside phosphotransferase (APT) family kinase protein
VSLDTVDGTVVVRIPIPGADVMDLKLWPEGDILTGLALYVPQMPQLLHSSSDPEYQVQEYVVGDLLNSLAPRGTPLPGHVLTDVVHLFRTLWQVPRDVLPPAPEHWASDGDTSSFAGKLLAVTQQVYERSRGQYESVYRSLKVPEDPLGPVVGALERLRPRKFSVVHADVHRKNVIVRSGHSVFLDWELALWGDPLYDLAVHLHKMGYLPFEYELIMREWSAAMASDTEDEWQEDLIAYLAHEQVKSVLVDAVRYTQQVRGQITDGPRWDLIDSLTVKINQARRHWGIVDPIERDEVAHALLGGA